MKNKKIMAAALIILFALTALFAVMLILTRKTTENIPHGSFLIKSRADDVTVSMAEFEQFELKEFTDRHRNSRGTDILQNYGGVELITLLNYYNIPLDGAKSLTLYASDGFSRVYSLDEVIRDGNVYITTKCEGEPLIEGITGSINDGGPYLVIKRSDMYSENRVKKFNKIIVNYD